MRHLRDLTLYVVRHGQTEDNVAGRWTGRNDSHLTDIGRRNARVSGEVLRRVADDLDGFDFVASPLHRACVTMELLLNGAGLHARRYRTDRRLMENDAGDFTGLAEDHIRTHHREHHARLSEDEWNWTAPGGQSQAEQYAQIGRFLATVGRHSVIVCHGLTIRLLRAHVLGLAPKEAVGQPFHDTGVLRYQSGHETLFEV